MPIHPEFPRWQQSMERKAIRNALAPAADPYYRRRREAGRAFLGCGDPLLFDSGVNQCALKTRAYTPCNMTAPDWASCPRVQAITLHFHKGDLVSEPEQSLVASAAADTEAARILLGIERDAPIAGAIDRLITENDELRKELANAPKI